MLTRHYRKEDADQVMEILAQYWTDPDFLNEVNEKLNFFVDKKEGYYTNKYRFLVAEKNGEVAGVAGLRIAPRQLREYLNSQNPAELYIIVSKLQGEGVGSLLLGAVISEAVELHFTEVACYSPQTHESSWKFYKRLGFTKHGLIKDYDDGYTGMIWRKNIQN